MSGTIDQNKLDEIRSAQEAEDRGEEHTFRKPFGTHWGSACWIKRSTVTTAIMYLDIPERARILDIGVGTGWTTLFLAEAGYDVFGVTLAPAAVEIAEQRAARWSSPARFDVGDMEELKYDSELISRWCSMLCTIPNGRPKWSMGSRRRSSPVDGFCLESPPCFMAISPRARRVNRKLGWVERGIKVSALKHDCSRAGLKEFRRFFEGTSPYESRAWGFGGQLIRLIAANIAFASQSSIWLAARKSGT